MSDGCPILVLTDGGDHLYETCPALRRSLARWGGKARRCDNPTCDPLDCTVCGWCRRVWKARHSDA